MKITSLTSVFKGGKYIHNFMYDILSQTMFEDVEWYFLNCNSPDNEYEIIKPYLKDHKNIRYEEIDETISVYGAWNYMILTSDSQYLVNSNLDDRRFPKSLEKLYGCLENNDQYDLAYSYSVITDNDNDSYLNHISRQQHTIYPNGPYDKNNLVNHCYPGQSPLWRRSLHINYGLFDDNLRSAGDLDFWLKCVVGGCQDFVLVPEILNIYYMNPDGLSTSIQNSEWRTKEEIYVKNKYRNKL